MSQFVEMFGTINSPRGKMSSLGELCRIQRGGSPRPIKDYITTDSDGLNWIKIGDTDDSMYIKKTEEKIKPSGLKKTRQVYAGDLLLSNSMSFGRPYVLKIDGCIHDGWLVLHIKDESILTQIYLCAYLSQQSTYLVMSKLAAGGVVQNLNSEIVKKLPVILPPMQKQMEYVSILEQADKSEFGGSKSQFIEMFGDPSIDTKWPTKKLKELGSLDRGVSKARPRNTPELLGGPYPLIQTGDITEAKLYIKVYHQTYSELGLAQSKMWKRGTLCITIAANIAQTAILDIDACFPDSVVGFISNEVETIFIHYWFSFIQQVLERQAPQTAQKNINLKILSELDVIVPPKELQTQFVNIVLQADKSEKCCEFRLAS